MNDIPVKITTYDGFGRVSREIHSKCYPSYYKWPCIVVFETGESISMPSIVIEPTTASTDHLDYYLSSPENKIPHKVDLIALDGTIIRTWETESTPSLFHSRVTFLPKGGVYSVEVLGYYSVEKIGKEPDNE